MKKLTLVFVSILLVVGMSFAQGGTETLPIFKSEMTESGRRVFVKYDELKFKYDSLSTKETEYRSGSGAGEQYETNKFTSYTTTLYYGVILNERQLNKMWNITKKMNGYTVNYSRSKSIFRMITSD